MAGRWGRRPGAVALAPAALLALLGGVLLGRRQGLWYDELFTAHVAPLPLRRILSAVATGEGTAAHLEGAPPSFNAPYYVVTHVWLSVTGLPADDVGLRLLSLLACVAAVAVLAVAVRRLAGPSAGLAAGLLAAGNPMVLEYSVEARSYGLALLAVAVAVLGLARWLDGAPRALLLYGLGATVCGLAHWFALPVVAALALAALALRRRAALPLVAVSAVAVLPGLALVLLTRLNGAGTSAVSWIGQTGAAVPVLSLRAWTAGSALLLVVTVVAVVAGLVRGGRAAVVAAAWVAVPLTAVLLAELVRPVFVARYLLPALLGLAVLAALGATSWRPPVPAVATAVLMTCSLAAAVPLLDRGPREDGRGAARWLVAQHEPGEQVVAVDARAALALEHYAPGLGADLLLPPDDPDVGGPAPGEPVWLLRQSSVQGLQPSDDDTVLQAAGLRVAGAWRFPGSNTDLVVQRWEPR